jgi:predicted nucleic acid-binding protein
VVGEPVQSAVADTSVLVGLEAGRVQAEDFEGYAWAVSVVTLGELRLGVLRASTPETTARRLETYQLARQFDPLPIDEAVADAWAKLVAKLRESRRRMPINDSWIAATAIAQGVPVVTQDSDYDGTPDLAVIKI